MDEKEYRALVLSEFRKIEKAFEDVDPDQAEFEHSQGAVTIIFRDGSKLLLSQQPSVRQIWVAAATLGIAHHFGYDAGRGAWLDDKGKGVELLDFVCAQVERAAGVKLRLR